jgi:DNA-binding beta-propeller fold protein YncE
MKSLLALILSITLVAFAANALAGEDWKGKIYWTIYGGGEIAQANCDGSNRTSLVKTGHHPYGLIINAKNGFMYWTNGGQTESKALDGSIQRCQMNNCPDTVKTIVGEGKTAEPSRLTLDEVNGYIYWSDSARDLVQRSKLDGSNVETVLILKDQNKSRLGPTGCEIDEESGVLYWTERHTNRIGRVELANLHLPYTPKKSDYIVTEGLNAPAEIRIDKGQHKIVIAERYSNRISEVSLDGGIPNEIVNTKFTQPVGLTLDQKSGKIIFSELTGNKISSVNMDGTDMKKICDDAGPYPTSVSFVPETE